MENFVLYEELRQDNHSVMYKGRRRGTIEFVSIQCFEKCLRDQVTNSVRILHTFEHPNIIRFYEWYETDNHLWCIVELCTGGVLEDVIVQDGHLPEESILEFGLDLVTGLNYIHSMGVVLCELNSSKILLDNNGVLKYFDFSNAMLPGGHDGRGNDGGTNSDGSDEETTGNENVRQQARYGFSHDPQTGSEPVIGNLLYMAPEVVQGGECSTASDLWSFGCVLYELYYGVPPFSGQTFEEVLHRTLNEELREFPAVEGEHPSEQFQNLVSSLLIKDHTKRISWPQVISHPFWGDTLLPHSKRSVSVVTAIKSDVEAQDERPHTAPFVDNAIVKDATFTLSGARPQTALPVLKIPEQVVRSQHNEQCQQKEEALFQTDEPDLSSKDQKICDAVSDVRQLLFHSSDVTVLPIFGSSKIHKMPALKWDSKALPFAALEIDVCREMDSAEFDGQLIVIERALVTSSAAGEAPGHRSATNSARAASNALETRGKLHIAAYLYHICQNTDLANHVVNSPLFAVLISMLKGSKVPLDLKCRLVMILGRLARYSTLISQDLDLSEVLTVLSDLLRDNFRNVELKLGLVAALGEFLFYVVSEEQREGKSLPQWKVPMLLYTLIIRCLKEGETAAAQHYAVKTIMNVASTGGKQCEPFASCDTILALWTIHLNSKQDAMKSMTLSAICRLVRYDPILGQHFVERVGLQPVVSLLSSSHSKFQQPVVTIFNVMLVDNVAVRKLLMDRDFLSHAVLLLEHPSCLLRGKAYLTVALSAEHSSETLLSCCHARLISCIDRDIRRQASQSKSLDDSLLYLIHCLDYLIATVLKLIPQITDGIVESLSTIAGRKHPSAAQSKLLRANLPLLPVLGYFASSSAFTSNMMTVSFLRSLGILLSHAAHIDCGDAGLGSNAGLSVVDFCDGVFDVVHASLSSPHVIDDHTEIVLMHLLPSVALFLRERHVETRRMLSVGLLSDALQRVVTEVDRQVYFSGLQAFVGDCLLSCLPALIEPSGSMRLSIIQLLAVLVEADSGVQSQVAEDVGAIHSLMSIIPDCFNNLQDPTFSALMTLTRCLSSSSCLDRNILLSAGFLRHLATSLDRLTSILFDQLQPSPRGAQLQQQQHLVMTSLMPTLECLSSQLEYLLVVQQQLEQVVDKSGFEKLISAHSELLLCMPNLFQLISVEDTLQSAARCLLAMLQLYSQQFGQQFGADEMKHVLSALESHSCDQSVVLNIVTGLVTYQILQSGGRIQADGLKQLKRSVMKLQKRTNEKHIKNLTADVLQRLS